MLIDFNNEIKQRIVGDGPVWTGKADLLDEVMLCQIVRKLNDSALLARQK